ncbi:MAG: COX15/CtaA family protein [Candidatus Caldarchaeum sp.]|nr:COX15/CtaA family protein [Candidatus Caldarchaeum sp.]
MKVSHFTVATTVLAVATMALGSYVSKVGAGLACPDWPLCPLEADPFILLEFGHRIIAFATFLTGLVGFIAASKTSYYRGRKLVHLGFTALTIQVFIVGALVIFTALPPLVVALHQAAAASVVALYAAASTAAYYANVDGKHKNRADEKIYHV